MKKVAFVLLITFLSWSSQAQITKDSAYTILSENVGVGGDDVVEIYMMRNTVGVGDTISLLGGRKFTPASECWFYFIDDYVYANWAHPCRYVFIDVSTGEVEEIKEWMPPYSKDSMECVCSPRFPQTTTPDMLYDISADPPVVSSVRNNHYAVIINGGGTTANNAERFWNNCSAVYKTLVYKYGYDTSKIYVLMSDGPDPGVDMTLNNTQVISSPLDLDNNGTNDIQYMATDGNIEFVFSRLQDLITDSSHVFVYVTGHGDTNSALCLWDDTRMLPAAFKRNVDKVNLAKVVNVLMQSCYSGIYANNIDTNTISLGGNSRVITTACSGNEPSWSTPDNLYGEFTYHWLAAVNGAYPDGSVAFADNNWDGHISMKEAYLYARRRDNYYRPYSPDGEGNEHPQYSSAGTIPLGEILTLDRLLKYYDLFVRDDYGDIGNEPYSFITLDMVTSSPDIWVRRHRDGGRVHQLPRQGATNHVYVRVQNKGPFRSDSVSKVSVYVKKAGVGGLGVRTWPSSWTRIGQAYIPPIDEWDTAVVCVSGQFPNLEGWPWQLHKNANYTLLARIESAVDRMTVAEDSITAVNIWANNNIACRNVVLYDAVWMGNGFADMAAVSVANTSPLPANYGIAFSMPPGTAGTSLVEDADVRLLVDTALGAALYAGSVDGLERIDDTTFAFNSDYAGGEIALRGGYSGYARLLVRYTDTAHAELDQYEFMMGRTDLSTDEEEVLTIAIERPDSIGAWQPTPQAIPDSIVSIAPNPSNGMATLAYSVQSGAASVVVQDWQGAIVYSSPLNHAVGIHLLNLTGLPAGQYLVRLIVDGVMVDSETMIVY